MQDAPLRVIHQHVFHIRRAQRAACQRAHRVQIEVIQRVGQGIGQLAGLRLTAAAQLFFQQLMGALLGDLDDFVLDHLQAMP